MDDLIDTVVYGTLNFFEAIKSIIENIFHILLNALVGTYGLKGYIILAIIAIISVITVNIIIFFLNYNFVRNLIKVFLIVGIIILIAVAIIWGIGFILALTQEVNFIQLILVIGLIGSLGTPPIIVVIRIFKS